MIATDSIPKKEEIEAVAQRIAPYVHRTLVLSSESINAIAGCSIHFKCENLQKVGAFKMRGATNAVLSLTDEEKAKGVATHSSGNHAQALALSAKIQGIQAYIVMPETAPEIKKKAVAGYGAEIILCPPTLQDRESNLEKVVAETGASFIPPYNDYRIVAGQATAAMELLEDTDELEYILTPVGGGGLLSGTALSASYFSPNTKVIGAEPEGADDAYRSFKSGELIPMVGPNTIADGLLTSLGPKTFGIIREYVDDILLVNEDEIKAAMRMIWERMKIIIEPSSAVPLAAVLKNKEMFTGKNIGIIISGGNVDVSKLPF
jgi:threonine dehydratase